MLAHANEPFLSTCPRTGAEILLCSRHGKEYCYECPADYVETNREARQEAERKKAVRPEGDKLGKGLLVVGSHVRLEDRSGRETVDHLDGIIRGGITISDSKSAHFGEFCYVIERLDDHATYTYPTKLLHREYLVQVNGEYVPVRELLKFVKDNAV